MVNLTISPTVALLLIAALALMDILAEAGKEYVRFRAGVVSRDARKKKAHHGDETHCIGCPIMEWYHAGQNGGPETEEARRKREARETAEAFQTLTSYSADTAYGQGGGG